MTDYEAARDFLNPKQTIIDARYRQVCPEVEQFKLNFIAVLGVALVVFSSTLMALACCGSIVHAY